MRLVLASASPRRAELLEAAGFEFDVDPMDVDERVLPDEAAVLYVDRVARLKAAAAALRHPHRIVVAADTVVLRDEEILGKPRDTVEAHRMLHLLSGRSHEVLTAVAVAARGGLHTHLERTTVWFLPLSETDITWYVGTGEPMDKAGGYAIQGRASRFIPRIDGSYTNVVGLPIAGLARLLEEMSGRATLPRPAGSDVDIPGAGPYPEE
ncbi:MAG: septum formation inhibitor Maf [Acidobacteria bacterium]|nr:septum formation inhibitor Maf [Acidobacteriota bacterium]